MPNFVASCCCHLLWLLFVTVGLHSAHAQAEYKYDPAEPDWAPFVESDFPFFSSVLDARQLGKGWVTNNLTPRGIILNLGQKMWVCFDVDLLRISAVWEGDGLTPDSMAQGSYSKARALIKAPEGQGKLPRIAGTPWLANGMYPGWQSGDSISFEDPREPVTDPREVGRGPLTAERGRFKAIRLLKKGVQLEYEIAGSAIEEVIDAISSDGKRRVQRTIRVGAHSSALSLAMGGRPMNIEPIRLMIAGVPGAELVHEGEEGIAFVRLPPSREPSTLQIAFGFAPDLKTWEARKEALSTKRWENDVVTLARVAGPTNNYVLDTITLPLDNPWHRNVRLADVGFFAEGTAALVTFDGDVWIVRGLKEKLEKITWTRFTSGLHEPMGIVVRNDELFVFDRNGIWRLRDLDKNGEADVHELFSNVFTQTAETREFTTGLKLAPDGSFVVAKGGQQSATVGKHNGAVLRISPDGKRATVLGYGLRMPFIGVHPVTGLVTASDQQGHYIPTTPLHIIADQQYYGFIPTFLPKEKYPAPIADPLTWIPHPINASGVSQVWLSDKRIGPLHEALIHLGYYRSEMFLVRMHDRGNKPQAAVMSLTRDFDFPLLNGTINPADGLLYVTGFQIWGTVARNISGLARFRYTAGPSLLPQEVVAMDKGILLRFEVELREESVQPSNLSAERWNYKRTAEYGSPHYLLDGSKGQETLTASSAYLSKNRKAIFIGIPDMRVVMQMRVGWTLETAAGTALSHNAYFTPHELIPFNPVAEEFEEMQVDLTPRTLAEVSPETPLTVPEGQRLAELMGCVACHSSDGSTLGKVGPSWKGLYKSERKLAGGKALQVDEEYLRRAIREPSVEVVAGFDKSDTGMPSYEGILTEPQIEALILYIKSLQ